MFFIYETKIYIGIVQKAKLTGRLLKNSLQKENIIFSAFLLSVALNYFFLHSSAPQKLRGTSTCKSCAKYCKLNKNYHFLLLYFKYLSIRGISRSGSKKKTKSFAVKGCGWDFSSIVAAPILTFLDPNLPMNVPVVHAS